MADIKNIDVFQTVTSVSFEVEPNTDIININKITTTGYSGVPNLQDVTDVGATTTNAITANSFIKSGGTGANVLLDNGSTTPLTSIVGTTNLTYTSGISNGVVNSNTGTDATIPLADGTNAGLFSATEKTKLSGIASGAEVNVNADWNAVSGDAQILNKPIIPSITGLATTTYVDNKDNSQQLQLNYLDRDNSIFDAFYLRTIADGGTVEASNQLLSSLAVLRNISYVNQGYTQQINADKFVKLGGAADEYLMADGSISYGGGGGGGATNLTTTQTISNFTINSNTGTDATVPLGNGSLAGATLNDYTTAEKNKLAGIATGAEVNVNADWNAVSGDAQILNKPTITNLVPYTGATTDVDLGLNDITAQKLIKQGGFDYQFLKADGSVDNNIYLTSADLPSTLDLYATTTASDISGYTVLVRNIADTRYNATAVDVSTGVITSVGQLVGSLITDANIISGNPGVFDFKTIGNISRTSGTGQAEFFFRIYKRNLAGTETLIAESDYTLPVTNGGYVEFSATALWNDGIFLETDRVVLKYYANRLTSPVGSDPTYQFQFGGASPVRSSAAIPTSVMPNIYLRDLADVENVDALNNEILYWNDTASLWEHSLAENLVPLATETQKGLVSTGTQTFSGAKTFADNLTAGRYLYSGGSIFPELGQTFYMNATGATHHFGGGIYNAQNNLEVSNGTLKIGLQTASTIASFDANKNVVSLPLATYPSLTEISYVKGVTSSIQTQFSGKQATLQSTVNIKSINGNSILGSGDLTISGAGISSLNGLTGATQTFSTTTNTGTGIPAWTSSGTNHQLNIPIAGGATTTGLITGTSQQISGTKEFLSNPQIPVPAGNSGPCIVLGSTGGGGASGTISIGDTATYPNAQEIQRVKGVTSNIQTQLDGKQPTLTAGNGINITTNTISTVDVSRNAFTLLANNTNASAVPTEQPFVNLTNQTYSGTIVWTGGTAPSGATQHTYSLSQIGNLVTLVINLSYANAGASTLTNVACELPNTAPTPALPISVTAVGDVLNYGSGIIFVAKTLPGTASTCALRIKSLGTPNVYEVSVSRTAAAYRYAYITIQYFV